MKAYKPKSLLLSLLLIITVSFSLTAQDARKEYTESYDISKGLTLATDVKYSEVELLTWDKDVVDILAVVEIDAPSKSKAEETLKKININIGKSGKTIMLETEMDQGWSRGVKVSIEFTVKAPEYINLNMDHSYGDVFIQEVSGHVLLDLKYSNLKAGILSRAKEDPLNQMELAYSNGTIDKAGWIEMELAYSDMEINDSEMLSVESKYSKILGEKAGSIVAEGAYDKYFIDEIDSFEGELKYSGIKFGVLNQKMVLRSGYSGAKILKLKKSFDKIDATLSYGGIHIGVEDGASFKLEAESKYGNVNISKEGKLSKKKENSYKKVWGTVGSNPKSTIHLVTKYGNIDIE